MAAAWWHCVEVRIPPPASMCSASSTVAIHLLQPLDGQTTVDKVEQGRVFCCEYFTTERCAVGSRRPGLTQVMTKRRGA